VQSAVHVHLVRFSGGNWLYLTPRIGALIGRESTCKAEVKLPLYRSLANTQLDSSAIFQVGISRSF
jgi:hypothetical protein